jgi:polyhydroxybutyrate depolymerase
VETYPFEAVRPRRKLGKGTRRRRAPIAIVGLAGLLVAGFLAVIALNVGGLGSGRVAGRATAPPVALSHRASSHPASSQPASSHPASSHPASSHPAGSPAGLVAAHPGASVADGLLPSPVDPPAGWAVTVHHLLSGGLDRYYLVARPSAPSTERAPTAKVTTAASSSLPVLVVLHGRMMTPADMMATSHFLTQVGRAIVVYPSGYDQSWNAGYCCGGAHRANVNDVAFLRAVVDQVVAQQPGALASHVYLAGYSNGGRMAYRMACDDPGVFAGVAAVEAISVSSCASADPVPLLIVASQGDPLLTIGLRSPPKHIEGHTETTVQAEVAAWRVLEHCQPADTAATIGDVTTQTWSSCAGRGRVEAAVYGGGSHAWFKACRATPSAQALVWAFFHGEAPPAAAGDRPARPA